MDDFIDTFDHRLVDAHGPDLEQQPDAEPTHRPRLYSLMRGPYTLTDEGHRALEAHDA